MSDDAPNKTALVVDDSSAMRMIVKRALKGSGWNIVPACNGEQALKVLEELDQCDFIVTDWHMPVMDGLEFVQRVRAQDSYKETPILLVTSDDVAHSPEVGKAGVSAYITKPFLPEHLKKKIAALVG